MISTALAICGPLGFNMYFGVALIKSKMNAGYFYWDHIQTPNDVSLIDI